MALVACVGGRGDGATFASNSQALPVGRLGPRVPGWAGPESPTLLGQPKRRLRGQAVPPCNGAPLRGDGGRVPGSQGSQGESQAGVTSGLALAVGVVACCVPPSTAKEGVGVSVYLSPPKENTELARPP